ncbi:MAG: DUF1294 domain-containing protein [Proteobacteria bacterium]|nr:DUF1294 domain-containing protein [Pseudomonadota bacterium]
MLFKLAALKMTVLYLGMALLLTKIVLPYTGMLEFVGTWLLVINSVLFCAMGKDKLMAKLKWGRTPEGTLLWLAITGGFPGLFFGRFLFNHKSSKKEFIRPMWILFILQLILIIYYFSYLDPAFK